jgi:hypothetical protein
MAKVQITYRADVEDIPHEVRMMFHRSRQRTLIEEAFGNVALALERLSTQSSKPENVEATMKLIDAMRVAFVEADVCLEDCYNILGGYKTLLLQEQKEENETD